jgi:hypothetical protein
MCNFCNDYYKPNPCCPDKVNNNIVDPPVVIKDCPDHKDKHPKCKLKDFFSDTAYPQDSCAPGCKISTSEYNPTVVAQLTVTDIKAGDRVWLNGLFHIDNGENSTVTADVRIYRNNFGPMNQIYRATIDIENYDEDDEAQISVQDVKTFPHDIGSVTYLLTVFIKNNKDDVKLEHPITFTASLIGY